MGARRYAGNTGHEGGDLDLVNWEGRYGNPLGSLDAFRAGMTGTELSGGPDAGRGTAGDDLFRLQGGHDRFEMGKGHDWVAGGRGDDQVWGGAGDDFLIGDLGSDKLWGDRGNDILDGGAGNDYLAGRDGDDILVGWTGDDLIVGDAGDDRLHGNAGSDTLRGGEGNDFLNGGGMGQPGDLDVLEGGPGNDTIHVDSSEYDTGFGSASAWVAGGAGDDEIWGGGGQATLQGGAGNDVIVSSGANETILGGAGDDTRGIDWWGDGDDLVDLGSGKNLFAMSEYGRDTFVLRGDLDIVDGAYATHFTELLDTFHFVGTGSFHGTDIPAETRFVFHDLRIGGEKVTSVERFLALTNPRITVDSDAGGGSFMETAVYDLGGGRTLTLTEESFPESVIRPDPTIWLFT